MYGHSDTRDDVDINIVTGRREQARLESRDEHCSLRSHSLVSNILLLAQCSYIIDRLILSSIFATRYLGFMINRLSPELISDSEEERLKCVIFS
jgi:hypothetical protein